MQVVVNNAGDLQSIVRNFRYLGRMKVFYMSGLSVNVWHAKLCMQLYMR